MPYSDPASRRARRDIRNARDRERYALTGGTADTRRGRYADRDPASVAAAGLARAAKRLDAHPFRGVDGEGGDLAGSHEYFLLRAGAHTLKTGKPLMWLECLDFLCDLPADSTNVAFYFDYDVTMMLRSAPPDRIRALFANPNPMAGTRIGPFDVRYLPHKEFAVRRHVGQALRALGVEPAPYTVISDVGPFFQSSFVRTLADWDIGTPEQRETITKGKALRSTFAELSQDTDDYNALEIELLESLMTDYAAVCVDVGYVPAKWQGPGQLATAVLRAHRVPRRKDIPALSNVLLCSLANAAYYGGRFETTVCGPVPGPVHEYDIRSAYPYAMTKLPCLVHGTWKQRRKRVTGADKIGFGMVTFDHDVRARLCHLPVRTEAGGLMFPRAGSGVYWSVELDAAVAAGTRITAAGTWFEYVKGRVCDCSPFGFVPELYAQRRALGGKRGKILKLGLNSLYGKMAQSIGTPAYANPLHAGLITATTRAQLIDAYRDHQDDVIMLATDAVYATCELPGLDQGTELGRWEHAVLTDGVFVIMPGVYFAGNGARSKTRGISAPLFDANRDKFREAFTRLWLTRAVAGTQVKLTAPAFTSLKLAYAWGNPQAAGQWPETPRMISFDWTRKRDSTVIRDPAGFYRTLPRYGGVPSVPYGKVIGGVQRESRELASSQPDYSLWFNPS